jgi:hypothetical protein
MSIEIQGNKTTVQFGHGSVYVAQVQQGDKHYAILLAPQPPGPIGDPEITGRLAPDGYEVGQEPAQRDEPQVYLVFTGRQAMLHFIEILQTSLEHSDVACSEAQRRN